ncbi:hypothetical protein OAN22_00615 [Alphaproteobacteria bacterium]|nr:hypothetical protein [Alphaproteobacteria bacterium]
MTSEKTSLSPRQRRTRVSRLFAVQTTYSAITQNIDFMAQFEKGPDQQLPCFDDETPFSAKEIERSLVRKLLFTLDDNHAMFQNFLSETLGAPHPWATLDKLLQSIVLCAVSEIYMEKAPLPVIVNEYLEITRSFYDEDPIRLIHGALQAISEQRDLLLAPPEDNSQL